MSYSLFYDEEIGCSALTIDSVTFLKICKHFPDSFRKLRERSEGRRKILKIYKYEALKDIVELTLEKLEDRSYLQKAEKMYKMIGKEYIKPEPLVNQARDRIKLLKSLTLINTNNLVSPYINSALSSRLILDQEVKAKRKSVAFDSRRKLNDSELSFETDQDIEHLRLVQREESNEPLLIAEKRTPKQILNQGFEQELPRIGSNTLKPDV